MTHENGKLHKPGEGGGGTTGTDRDWWNRTPSGLNRVALQQIAALLRQYPGAVQIGEFTWATPEGRVLALQRDKDGNPALLERGADESARILRGLDGGTGGGGGGGGATGPTQAELDLAYAKLNQDERQAADTLAYQYANAGLDANAARQQALATLITNRNTQATNLAGTSGEIAKNAAQFAANPRDAVADLMYRNAIGGPTPYGNIDNPQFGNLQSSLGNKFQELFGGVGGDLQRARGLLDAPLPQEYLAPGAPQPGPAAAQPNLELQGALQFIQGVQQGQQQRGTQQYNDDFMKWVTAANKGVPPTTAEAGVNMNIMEPSMVVGKSGRIYATLSEEDPEQLIVKPLPSVVERKKQEKESGKKFMEATKGAARMQQGGVINATPQLSDLYEQLRKALSGLGGTGGGVGPATRTALPSPRLLAGAPANALAEDPDLLAMTQAGYSALGISPETLAATVRKFTPVGARTVASTIPRVSF